MRASLIGAVLFAAALAVTAAACGGGGDSTPTAPSGGGSGSGGGPIAATIIIGADGRVSPASATVALGSRVTFTNNDSVVHDMNSDPHPAHTDCPALNVGSLGPGQSRTSENLTAARACGFHDHLRPTEDRLMGRITVQ
jgi:plastocyanin